MVATRLSDLSAAAAASATDLFYTVQTAGVGGLKMTGAQLKTFMSASPTLVTPTLGVAQATSIQFTDATISRDAANILALSNGANAQALRFYNLTGANSEYGEIGFKDTVNTLTITTRATGSGTPRAITISAGGALFFQVNGAAGPFWSITTGGIFQPNATGTLDIGTSSLKVRDAYFSRDIFTAGGAQAMLRSSATFTSGAGAATGTLTNAPAAGNPTSWIKINDNGTNRFIPAW